MAGGGSPSTHSHSSSGRERAIEALIDREPQGDFYRAARVVDEAVPIAQGSRPNLVTKAALVEQAFSLAVHDVDTVAKYDAHMSEIKRGSANAGGSSSRSTAAAAAAATTTPKKVDALTKQRIFHYQAKIAAAKQQLSSSEKDGSNSANSNTPPASLVASLRQVYEEPTSSVDSVHEQKLRVETSNVLFELRHLLEAVSSHTVFQANSIGGNTSTTSTPATDESCGPKNLQANLEKLILNVTKQDSSTEDSDNALQGLLISILSVLAAGQQQQQAPTEVKDDLKKTKMVAQAKEEPQDQEHDDMPFQSVLQVGALLSLLPLEQSTLLVAETKLEKETSDGSKHSAAVSDYSAVGTLDPVLLEYFGEAAAVYEERLEIQKARMLARMKTPSRPSSPPTVAAVADGGDPVEEEQPDGVPVADTPIAGDSSARSTSEDELDFPSAAAVELEQEVEQQEIEARGAPADDDEEEEGDGSSGSDSEEDEGNGEEDEPYESNSEGMVEDVASAEDDDDDDGDQPGDDGGEESSSSSDSEYTEEGDRMIGGAGAGALDTDDEDESLRQALAMSIAEHEAASEADVASDTAPGGTESSTDGINVHSSSPGEDDNVQGDDSVPVTEGATLVTEESPVSMSSGSEEREEEDDSDLPSFPTPPASHPFSFRSDTSGAVAADDPDAMASTTASMGVFDPSSLSVFASIPTSSVLFHLLRYTEAIVERRLTARMESTGPPSVVVGGIGSSLFAPDRSNEHTKEEASTKSASSAEAKQSSTLQLLVASLLLMMDQRDDAVENLRKAVAREQRVVQDGNTDTDDDGGADDDDSSRPPLSGEEDDPALTLAMNYVEDDVPLSSDSLENKGMRRKAAAAAHDAAALLKSLQKRTDAWKNEVRLYSVCVGGAMKLLRQFLQAVVRRSFGDEQVTEVSGHLSVLEFHAYLPSFVVYRLADTMSSLTAVDTQSACLGMLGGDAVAAEEIFQSLALYRESLSLWGECIPFLHSSEMARSELLKSMVQRCSSSSLSKSLTIESLEELSSFPVLDVVPIVHKLRILCRRLRIRDLLDGFVSRPVPFLPDDGVEGGESGDYSMTLSNLSDDPCTASSLISALGGSMDKLIGARHETKRLHLALCHRVHTRILLFDGFYATTETESDDRPSSSSAKALTTGDAVRVSAGPSSSLQFDATKCSDSIARVSGFGDPSGATSGHGSVNQRASKVWGAVLSTHQYSPKTGVHRWAVRLDKCERGHVFIGVATAQASTRTYVGGDKHGWGMIGTQALWHDRRKIRGDYGATFRTGSTIIVTLDSDAGTLSFSTWKDSSTSSSFSLDPSVQNIVTPRRSGLIGGTVEDWGVAFEGLPLDSKLYPAVGLYQRDDRVTLLSVESPGASRSTGGMIEVSGGECFFPRSSLPRDVPRDDSKYISTVRHFNDLLSWDGVRYAETTLNHAVEALQMSDAVDSGFILKDHLPALAAAICLLPATIPVLSARCALYLMPHLNRAILALEKFVEERQRTHSAFPHGVREGKWTIRATGTPGGSVSYEEYLVDFKATKDEEGSIVGIEGTGVGTTGKSKNGLVKIVGCVKGSSLTFIEDWTEGKEHSPKPSTENDASSCVVSARLSVDGRKFEGAYRNVQYGSTGQIVGMLPDSTIPGNGPVVADLAASAEVCESLLCLAQNHLSNVLGDDAAGDFDPENSSPSTRMTSSKRHSLTGALARPLLSGAALGSDSAPVVNEIRSLKKLYAPPLICKEEIENVFDTLHAKLPGSEERSENASSLGIAEQVAVLDEALAPNCGGTGSLRNLCSSSYTKTRRLIISAMLFHCGLYDEVIGCTKPKEVAENLLGQFQVVWSAALQIMESGVRKALSLSQEGSRSQRCDMLCQLFSQVSLFLLSLEFGRETDGRTLSVGTASAEFTFLFQLIDDPTDLEFLKTLMSQASKRGIMRCVALDKVSTILSVVDPKNTVPIEALIVGLPRLLGRGKDELSGFMAAVLDHRNEDSMPEIDGSYFSRLSGSLHTVRDALRSQVCGLFRCLGRVADSTILQRSVIGLNAARVSSSDSLTLAIMTIFVGNIRQGDIDEILSGSAILEVLPKILAAHRSAILREPSADTKDGEVLAGKALQHICQRDISRAILRSAVAAAHLITYQASFDSRHGQAGRSTTVPCLSFLLAELAIVFPLIEQASVTLLSEFTKNRSDEEWKCWKRARRDDSSAGSGSNATPKGEYTCLDFLRTHGTMLSSVVQGGQQKQSLSSKPSGASGSRKGTDLFDRVVGGFAHQYLSHWLHVLCSVLRSQKALSGIVLDSKWLTVLFEGIGLDVDLSADGDIVGVDLRPHDDGVLPARFRARLLRLMLPFLSALEPCKLLIEGLLHLAGVASAIVTRSLDDEESQVSRESVSLLRHLHSPLCPRWREQINLIVGETTAAEANGNAIFCKRVGIFSFFSGGLETVSRGSYVLLKPAAASSLSPDHQSSPSTKNQPGGIGGNSMSAPAAGATPHHIVGNGTGSVIAGLCRAQASAGIVSNIDLKSGLCEVILVARGQKEQMSPENEAKRKWSTASGKSGIGGRHTLTVRALRTPLADVVYAQEVPLFFDDSIPFGGITGSILKSSLDSLSSAIALQKESLPSESNKTAEDKSDLSPSSQESPDTDGESKSLRSGVASLSADLMAIRCCIVILSNKRMLTAFRGQEVGKEILSKVLAMAWPDDNESAGSADFIRTIRKKGLSSLPIHEARFRHLTGLLRELNFRTMIMKEASEDQQTKRMDMFKANESEGVETLVTSSGSPPSRSVSRPVTSDGSAAAETARDIDINASRTISQSTGGSNSEDEEETEAAATAAAHLREAAIAQMSELGLPRAWSELALRRTGGINIEAAVTFCLERGPEIERMLAEEEERDRDSSGGVSAGRRDDGPGNRLLRQLLEMGFPKRWCTEAMAVTGNNVDEALTWILNNGERLSEEDEAMENESGGEGDGAEDEESADEDETEVDDAPSEEEVDIDESKKEDVQKEESKAESDSENTAGWTGSVIPLRFISGRAIVNPDKMEISGLPSGGFSSVGTKGILLTTGKWYYEAVLETAGCLQIGWADGSFAGHCHADRGDGCGDGPSSWAYDGWRRYRWHATATEWGCRWNEGDVVGCLVDMDNHIVSFALNGEGESIGMGEAFSGEGFRPCGGVYACVSFNRKEKLRLILGGSGSEPFKHEPPPGYRGVGEAVLVAVQERDALLEKESILDTMDELGETDPRRFLCDFSDGEHGHELMAWGHRYYGSDASVHLGSGRLKPTTPRSSSSPSTAQSKDSSCVTRRLEKAWAELARSDPLGKDPGYDELCEMIHAGYEEVHKKMVFELFNECITISILLSRKLLLHILVTEGGVFDAASFFGADSTRSLGPIKFWKVIEVCTSLRNAGWVGEAGAMAIAAEALGLGISSNDSMQPRSSGERLGVVSAGDLDEGLFLPAGGITQVLTSVLTLKNEAGAVDTSLLAASCAEASMGSDGGGGLLAFLQEGLQSAVARSPELRSVLIAAIRRSVRRLAVVEYEGDDFDPNAQKADDAAADKALTPTTPRDARAEESEDDLPDARLAAFLTGLLLSQPVQSSVDDCAQLQKDLFEAWSVGLLSASLPWRMVCAFTAAGILNLSPEALSSALNSSPTLARYFGRLESTVSRRFWAERAAVPVCSRYAQSLVELLTSVRRAVSVCGDLPSEFTDFWGQVKVDAATPLPLNDSLERPRQRSAHFWESSEAWVSSDADWEVWTGTVEYTPVDWKTPSRSSVRTLMDGGDGPPLVREGCLVVRGIDWDGHGNGNDDGKALYDVEKSLRDKEKRLAQEEEKELAQQIESTAGDKAPASSDPAEEICQENPADPSEAGSPEQDEVVQVSPLAPEAVVDVPPVEKVESSDDKKEKKKKKLMPSPKLPIGTVLSIEPWNGIPGMARRVRWNLTGTEGVYRFGGDGGRYDLCHVETNSRGTRIKKRHPLPESAEQCASRHGFGSKKTYSVLLRQRKAGEKYVVDGEVKYVHEGVLEWPDFGSGVRVKCTRQSDGSVILEESQLLFGSKDSGWATRFGQPSFVSGSIFVLSPTTASSLENQADLDIRSSTSSLYQELLGNSTFDVGVLRNPGDGSKLKVTNKMRLFRGRRSDDLTDSNLPPAETPLPPPMTFDRQYHADSLSLSRDGRTISCVSSDGGRGTAFASMGFTKGVHYWEVKLEQADVGSVFIGVAEKPIGSGSGSSYSHDSAVRLNRWHGWGFVNFRATYTSGAERVFGSHCHAGDTVGVLLDCDAGRISFFFDGLKYGEHLLNDLGCAFENLSPFGFNVDGCGSGGAGQGAPSGFENGPSSRFPAQGTIRPRTLWPVIGLRNQGDRITLSSKWNTSYGVDGVVALGNVIAVDEILSAYSNSLTRTEPCNALTLPPWFVEEAFSEYKRWSKDEWTRSVTRGSGPYRLSGMGLDADFDASPIACATASASLGLDEALLTGDRVKLSRSAGRVLELAEEAVVLGAFQGRLYYRIVSQKSEGGSLTEGGGRAWCWDESEVVGGLSLVTPGKGLGVALPKLARFTCLPLGGLRVVYENGAVLRSDLEIFDGSVNLGTIPVNTVIPRKDVLHRRVNSCGVVRFCVRFESLGEGWISARIRGTTEEPIVEPVNSTDDDTEQTTTTAFQTPRECATAWYQQWQRLIPSVDGPVQQLQLESIEQFEKLIAQAVIPGCSAVESDSILTLAINALGNFCDNGDAVECPFRQVASAMSFALATSATVSTSSAIDGASVAAHQAAATVFAGVNEPPPLEALMARFALLRSFNRRARLALPWLSMRPCQEGSAILGGVCGHGTSPDRAGRARVSGSEDTWVQVPSIATKVRSLRGIFFTSVKRDFLRSITDATTTPTPLSHDEYELPREIRTVRINRLKAGRAMLSGDSSSKRKYCVFAQLQSETKNWGGAGLRRGYVAKGHGGQKRAFKVKLIGEGVNDYSGPYREAFTDAIGEVLMTDDDGRGALGVLDPSPNNASSIGDNRDIFMFSLNGRDLSVVANTQTTKGAPTAEDRIRRSFASLMAARDETSREVEEALVFLGRLSGTAFRHGISLDLPLPLASVWNALTEDPVCAATKLQELDFLAFRQLENDGDAEMSPLLWWQQRMLNSFAEGLSNVLPVEILPLMSGAELRDTICGNPDVDVDLLKQVVEYEGYLASDKVIDYFWETLNAMSNEERKQFLQFVWARNRLPIREADFDAPFKIQKDSANCGPLSDLALPSASTCFFSLTLPEYSSQGILQEKLLFAIKNVTTMETDFQTNSAEIAEGYRAF